MSLGRADRQDCAGLLSTVIRLGAETFTITVNNRDRLHPDNISLTWQVEGLAEGN